MRATNLQAQLLLILFLCTALPARAAGIGLRWDKCFADGGAVNKSFACDRNTGANILVGTFVLPAALSQVNGNEFTVDIFTASPTLPAWWQFRNTGACRKTALAINFVLDNNAVNCPDWTLGQSSGGIGAYEVDPLGSNTARIRGAVAVPLSALGDLQADREYFNFNLTINNQKSIGSGICGGCDIPACIAITSVTFTQTPPGGSLVLTTPSNGTNSNYVSWQGGAGTYGGINGTCVDFDSAGFSLNTSVVGRGSVSRSRTKVIYPPGSPVVLVGVPQTAERFVSWSGDTTTTDDTLNVIVTKATSVVANFERDPAFAPAPTTVLDAPNDEGGNVLVEWSSSALESGTGGLICCYDIQRAPLGSDENAWSTVATHSANAEPVYIRTAPSGADSTSSGNAAARYRILARDVASNYLWVSNAIEGYSVDNLPPPAPASVSGSIASGFASIFWPAVSVPDLSHYAIYRGTEASPPIDLAHRVGTTTSTGFTDSPGHFANYRVSAIDVHGNEGPATAFVPVIPAGVDNRPAPRSLAVEPPKPSPMTRDMAMSIGLPRELLATVDVLDAQGRVVRRLAEGQQPAGWSVVRWDATYADGRQAAAGLYFVRVHTSSGDKVARVVLLP